MISKSAIDSVGKVADRLRFALAEQLKDTGYDVSAALDSLALALAHVLEPACEEEGARWIKRLEESASSLFLSEVSGCDLMDAITKASEVVLQGTRGDGSALHALLRAHRAIMQARERMERERREELERRLREIDGFPDTIAATLDPPTLARMGLERLREMTGAASASLFIYQERGVYRCEQRTSGSAGGMELVLRGRAEEALVKEKGVYVGDDNGEQGILLDGMRVDGSGKTFLPLVVRGRTTGLIMLENEHGDVRLDGDSLMLARRFAGRMAVALENAGLHSREQRKIRETVALLELTRAINSTLNLEEVLAKVARMSVDLCGVTECVVYIWDSKGDLFLPGARCGFLAESGEHGGPRIFKPTQLDERHAHALNAGEAVLVEACEVEAFFDRQCMAEHGVGQVFLHPLSSRERLTGIMALFYPAAKGDGPGWEDRELIAAIAAQASMAIENAFLYEDIERSYYSTIKALARAIEVKDPYTHGHSERVTEYALMIADAMRLDEREKQKLKYAATLHDIGKIGIAGRVLNKPGALTEEEYSHVKTHPLLGDSIIEPVDFLQEPRPIILHHHERYDGKGYPEGLKGEDIPLCARILSVADAFEAMRSDRPYRRALPLGEAVEELRRNAGTQFDPAVVEVFLSVLEGYGGDPVNR